MLSVETVIQAQFYDLDPMNVVWHGNYARFLELGRCDLLDRVGYNYQKMQASGFAFPIVEMRLKYVAPIRLREDFVVTSTLAEYATSCPMFPSLGNARSAGFRRLRARLVSCCCAERSSRHTGATPMSRARSTRSRSRIAALTK